MTSMVVLPCQYHHACVASVAAAPPTAMIDGGSRRNRPTVIVSRSSQLNELADRKKQTTKRGGTAYSRDPLGTRISLVVALATQAFSLSQRLVSELAAETAKYTFPPRFQEARNLEEALMIVPDLETVGFEVLKKTPHYDVRQVEAYFIAETKMPGYTGFDLSSSSQAFNVLASYLFGKNTSSEEMEMTNVYTRKVESEGVKMEMTTPVITRQSSSGWEMSFVLPSKYGANLPSPRDSSVRIREVPKKMVAVTAFSGSVADEEISSRESRLRTALRTDAEFRVKPNALLEVAQFSPPFTLPFTRRNEISLEVERSKRT